MSKNKIFILLVGKSGSGKSTIADILAKEHGYKVLQSYTNRPKRTPDETGHTFLKEKNVGQIKQMFPNRVAETVFDGNFYFATPEQVDKSDIYIISPEAINTFKKNYGGKKSVKVLYLKCPSFLYKLRMIERGDGAEDADRRVQHDNVLFDGVETLADAVVVNIVASQAVDDILKIIETWRKNDNVSNSKTTRRKRKI